MSRHSTARHLLLLIALLTLAACTTIQPPQGTPDDTTDATDASAVDQGATADTSSEPVPPSVNPAVIALLDTAESDIATGRLQSAIASVERALRIEPKNPLLWQKLAKLKMEKGDYRQAENFAARSNSWAGANKALQAQNWRIISEARSLRGDNAGAKAALERARLLEQ